MKIVKLVASLTIIAAICAGVLAYVNASTKDAIKEIRARQTLQAAKDVMPAEAESAEPTTIDGVFAGKDKSGKIVGWAAKGTDTHGYGGNIVLMVGFTADFRVVTYRKLEASETPGLGMNLVNEDWKKQFSGIDANVPLKVKKDGGSIDAITSATITSRAVCGAINNATDILKGMKK